MADLGYHKLDLIRWLTGQDYVHMAAFSTTFEKNTTLEDSVVINFQLSSGTLGTIQVSWVFRPDWENSLVIRGERGVIRVPTEVSDPVKVLLLNRAGNIVETEHRCSSTDPSGWFGAVQAFVDAIQNQAPSPVSGEEGYLAMKAVLAASESVEQNKIVSLIRGR
jgi:predicted dehydrogenase